MSEVETAAFYRLGLLAGRVADEDLFEAVISACYVLGAERRYGDAIAWADVAAPVRERILSALANYPNALAKLGGP